MKGYPHQDKWNYKIHLSNRLFTDRQCSSSHATSSPTILGGGIQTPPTHDNPSFTSKSHDGPSTNDMLTSAIGYRMSPVCNSGIASRNPQSLNATLQFLPPNRVAYSNQMIFHDGGVVVGKKVPLTRNGYGGQRDEG